MTMVLLFSSVIKNNWIVKWVDFIMCKMYFDKFLKKGGNREERGEGGGYLKFMLKGGEGR